MDSGSDTTFFDRFPEPCLLLDASGCVIAANPLARAICRPLAEGGGALSDLVHPDDLALLLAALGKGTATLTLRGREGGVAHRWDIAPAGQDGRSAAILYPARQARSAFALRLPAVEAVSGVGSWSFDPETQESQWSDQTHRLHELSPGPMPPLDDILSYYTPASRLIVQQAVDGAIRDGTPYDLELQLRTFGGRDIWVRATGAAEPRAAGGEDALCPWQRGGPQLQEEAPVRNRARRREGQTPAPPRARSGAEAAGRGA